MMTKDEKAVWLSTYSVSFAKLVIKRSKGGWDVDMFALQTGEIASQAARIANEAVKQMCRSGPSNIPTRAHWVPLPIATTDHSKGE
jgi:hypothetical protein